MAQAVAAQALARAGTLLGDQALLDAADAAYASVPRLLSPSSPAKPWIALYSFDRTPVLNAQLQAALSVGDYADDLRQRLRGGAGDAPDRRRPHAAAAVRHRLLVPLFAPMVTSRRSTTMTTSSASFASSRRAPATPPGRRPRTASRRTSPSRPSSASARAPPTRLPAPGGRIPGRGADPVLAVEGAPP